MAKRREGLRGDDTGVAALEFALSAPIIVILMAGVIQVGLGFFANSTLRAAVETGARTALTYPQPSDQAISDATLNAAAGLGASAITGPTVTHGISNGVSWTEVTMRYDFPFRLAFVGTSTIPLSYTRRVYQN